MTEIKEVFDEVWDKMTSDINKNPNLEINYIKTSILIWEVFKSSWFLHKFYINFLDEESWVFDTNSFSKVVFNINKILYQEVSSYRYTDVDNMSLEEVIDKKNPKYPELYIKLERTIKDYTNSIFKWLKNNDYSANYDISISSDKNKIQICHEWIDDFLAQLEKRLDELYFWLLRSDIKECVDKITKKGDN